MRGRIDAEQLVNGREGAVAGDVEREQARRPDVAVAVEPDQCGGEREVPQQLVQERRVERRIGEIAVGPTVGSISSAHGRSVGRPNSSWLK
jgi:hypothetical protein